MMLGGGESTPRAPGAAASCPAFAVVPRPERGRPGRALAAHGPQSAALTTQPRLNLRPDGTLGSCLVPQAGP